MGIVDKLPQVDIREEEFPNLARQAGANLRRLVTPQKEEEVIDQDDYLLDDSLVNCLRPVLEDLNYELRKDVVPNFGGKYDVYKVPLEKGYLLLLHVKKTRMIRRETVVQLGYMQDCIRRDGAVGLFIFADVEAYDPVFESLFAVWEEENNGIGIVRVFCNRHIVHLMTINKDQAKTDLRYWLRLNRFTPAKADNSGMLTLDNLRGDQDRVECIKEMIESNAVHSLLENRTFFVNLINSTHWPPRIKQSYVEHFSGDSQLESNRIVSFALSKGRLESSTKTWLGDLLESFREMGLDDDDTKQVDELIQTYHLV